MPECMEAVLCRLRQRGVVALEASGRHVHLTREAALTLFGHALSPERPLSQPGQYLCRERLRLIGSKGSMAHVAVLGPERSACQVELSQTDCVALGVAAPLRHSGCIEGSPGLILETERGRLTLRTGVIVALRHMHMSPEDAASMGLSDGERVRLRTLTQRPVIFEEVLLRVQPDFRTYVHLDYDEANACGLRRGDLGLIL